MMMDKELFSHAVTLAAAFVANGDIRCAGDTNSNTRAMAQISDIIPSLYEILRDAQAHIAGK